MFNSNYGSVFWAHNEESWQQYNEKCSEMDPSRLLRQRKTKEHMEEDS